MNFLPFHESYFIEFKETIPQKGGILKSIVAFSNCLGGKIFIGVNDNGEILGVKNPEFIKQILKESIKNFIFPEAFFGIEIKKVYQKRIVLINVYEAKHKPVFYKDKIYIRELDKNLPISFFKQNEFKPYLKDEEKRVLNLLFRYNYFSLKGVKKRLNFSIRRLNKIFISLMRKGWIKNSVYYNKKDVYCLTPEGANGN